MIRKSGNRFPRLREAARLVSYIRRTAVAGGMLAKRRALIPDWQAFCGA
jgi:hypothetical protein